jgi:hypothetical protein
MHLPGAHKDRDNEYCDFQFRRNWMTEKGQVENFLCACPLRERCNCKCEAKIAIHPRAQAEIRKPVQDFTETPISSVIIGVL